MRLTVSERLIERAPGSDIEGGAIERVRAITHIEGVKIMEEYTMESVVRGHHVYKSIWHPTLGEQFVLDVQTSRSKHVQTSRSC